MLGSVSARRTSGTQSPTMRGRVCGSRNAPTLSPLDQDFDALGLQRTGTEESWARSATLTARRRVILSAGSVAGLCAVGLVVALFLRPGSHGGAAAAGIADPLPASSSISSSSAARIALAPATTATTASIAPSASSDALWAAAANATSAASAADAAPHAVHGQGPGQKGVTAGHSAPPGKADSAKPKAAPAHSSSGFELGY